MVIASAITIAATRRQAVCRDAAIGVCRIDTLTMFSAAQALSGCDCVADLPGPSAGSMPSGGPLVFAANPQSTIRNPQCCAGGDGVIDATDDAAGSLTDDPARHGCRFRDSHAAACVALISGSSLHTVIIAAAGLSGSAKAFAPGGKFSPPKLQPGNGRSRFLPPTKMFSPSHEAGAKTGVNPDMTIATEHCETPWSTDELAALMGVAGGRAHQQINKLTRWAVAAVAADIAGGMRPRNAASRLLAIVRRMDQLLIGDPDGTTEWLLTVCRVAADQTAEREMRRAAKRLGPPRPQSSDRTHREREDAERSNNRRTA